ncbi:MAG: putative stress-induced protein [Rhodospirillaceae bacterium]|nr:MAG: putative stress-induced protein [Rhodospirillaceae bacterium]
MSISSMTAFARLQDSDSGPPSCEWTWEARSVNAKGIDMRLRLPSGFEGVEFAAREMVLRRCTRGTVSLTLSVTRVEEQSTVRINETLLARLIEITAAWSERYPDRFHPPRLDGLLALPGVLVSLEGNGTRERSQTHERLVLQTLERVLDSLAQMRREEGGRLAAVLGNQIDAIAALIRRAGENAALQPEVLRDRLVGLVKTLLEASPGLPEERLAQEVALLASRADVREELDRLHAHVSAARQLLAEGGAVGRRLDFLCQEFGREANTLCAKSATVELTRIGLDLRATVDQLREQVQNIE